MADSAARQRDFDTPEGARLIAAEEWQHQRFGWLKAVRRDTGLSAQAQMLAHVLVLDYDNFLYPPSKYSNGWPSLASPATISPMKMSWSPPGKISTRRQST